MNELWYTRSRCSSRLNYYFNSEHLIVKVQAKETIEKYFFKAFLIKLTLSCFFAIDGKLSPCSFVRTIFC